MGLKAIAKELRISLLGGRYAADIWTWLGGKLKSKEKMCVASLRRAGERSRLTSLTLCLARAQGQDAARHGQGDRV